MDSTLTDFRSRQSIPAGSGLTDYTGTSMPDNLVEQSSSSYSTSWGRCIAAVERLLLGPSEDDSAPNESAVRCCLSILRFHEVCGFTAPEMVGFEPSGGLIIEFPKDDMGDRQSITIYNDLSMEFDSVDRDGNVTIELETHWREEDVFVRSPRSVDFRLHARNALTWGF